MTTATPKAHLSRTEAPARGVLVAYWALTGLLASSGLWAGALDVLRLPPLFPVLLHLGYPPYFAPLLGLWKIAGAVVLLAPRSPLLKEWAYAGMFIDYSSALVSHMASGDAAAAWFGPILSIVFLVGSWSLRPSARRLRTSWR